MSPLLLLELFPATNTKPSKIHVVKASAPAPLGYANASVPERFRGKTIVNKPKGFKEKVVALTFDDGPDPKNTPKVCAALAKYDAKATFFVIGSYANRHPGLLKLEAQSGHVVGNHSWSHPFSADKESAGKEISKTATAIHKAIGVWPTVFRPPYGIQNGWLARDARAEEYGVIIWNRSGADTAKKVTSEGIASNIVGAKPGDIVLLHDGPGKEKTVKAVPTILKALQKRGYKFVTVPEMLRKWNDFAAEQEANAKRRRAKSGK